jgi:MFS family permease
MAASLDRNQKRTYASLWKNQDFLKIWAAQSVALFGSEITTLALPLTAVVVLNASAFQMGVLQACNQLPFLLFSLLAGVWIDRIRRRPVLIYADLGRALLLLSIPFTAMLHMLGLPQLYTVAFGIGVLTVGFEIAHLAYVPSLLPRTQLLEGNSKIQTSHSVAESGGPGVAGVLIQAVSAPFAILGNAAAFLLSAVLLSQIRTAEPRPQQAAQSIPLRQAINEGLQALLTHPLLRVIIVSSVLSEFFLSALLAMYVLYASQELHLNAVTIGIVFAIGGVAAVPSAFLAQWSADRWGIGRTIVGGWLIAGLARLFIPLAAGPAAIAMLIGAQIFSSGAGAIANIHQWTFRQRETPDHLLGRVTASHRFLVYGAGSLGALLGGGLGAILGLRTTLAICAIGALIGPCYALCSQLRHLHTQSERLALGQQEVPRSLY